MIESIHSATNENPNPMTPCWGHIVGLVPNRAYLEVMGKRKNFHFLIENTIAINWKGNNKGKIDSISWSANRNKYKLQ